jgi:hypothetical protein
VVRRDIKAKAIRCGFLDTIRLVSADMFTTRRTKESLRLPKFFKIPVLLDISTRVTNEEIA